MSRVWQGVETVWLLAVAGVNTLYRHWALSLFSFAIAFGLWFIIQDVENPRTEGEVPAPDEQGITVEAVNIPEGVVITEIRQVRVRVEARQDDLADLHADDFRAIVDVRDIRAGSTLRLPVRIESKPGNVRVLTFVPDTVEVSAVEAFTKEMPVTLNLIGELPAGYQQGTLPQIEPAVVTVTGRQSLVESVTSVQADININGLRDSTTFDRELVARSANGSRVTVQLSQRRGTITYFVEPQASRRALSVVSRVRGDVADGFRITGITVDPSTVVVTGPENLVNQLESIRLEQIDVTGAKTDVTESVQLELPPGVEADRSEVFVTVTVEPINTTQTWWLGPSLTDIPDGLAPDAQIIRVEVRVSGPLDVLNELSPADLQATVSLKGAVEGSGQYTVTVTAPDGVTAEPVQPITITLVKTTP